MGKLDRFGMDPGAWLVLGLMWLLGLLAVIAFIVIPIPCECLECVK